MNVVNAFLAASIALAMFYTGLLFNPAWANRSFLHGKLRRFGWMALVNYAGVPLLTLGLINLVAVNPALSLTMFTLAALPCAPLVPALVTIAGEAPDWPLFVFLGFSLLSLLVVVLLTTALANSTTYAAHIGADTVTKLIHYFLLVYGPMTLGALMRWRVPGPAQRITNPMRALTGVALIVMLALYATVNGNQFSMVASRDIAQILAYVVGCALLGTVFSRGRFGDRLTVIIATCFRNIALGIAFATVVLRRPDVTIYLVLYSGVTVIVCGVMLAVYKLLTRRAARHATAR